jgi:hypothetical protein
LTPNGGEFADDPGKLCGFNQGTAIGLAGTEGLESAFSGHRGPPRGHDGEVVDLELIFASVSWPFAFGCSRLSWCARKALNDDAYLRYG